MRASSSWDELVWPATLIAAYVVVFVLYVFLSNSWPASPLFLGCCTIVLICREFKNPWSEAARGIALPSAIGFGFVTACLLVFNLLMSPRDAERAISGTEMFLLRLSHTVPTWATLTIWQVVFTLMSLVAINRWFPSFQAVATFRQARKRMGQVLAVLAVVVSLSFFSNEAVLGRMSAETQSVVTARYIESEERERRDLEKYLLFRAQAEALADLPVQEHRDLARVVRTLTTIAKSSPEAAPLIIDAMMQEHGVRSTASTEAKPPSTRASPPPELMLDAPSVLARQRQREASAARLASEAEQGFEEALKAAIGSGTTESLDVAHQLLTPIFSGIPIPFASEITTYLDKAAGEYVKQLLDPYVKKLAAAFADRIRWKDRWDDGVVRTFVARQVEEAAVGALSVRDGIAAVAVIKARTSDDGSLNFQFSRMERLFISEVDYSKALARWQNADGLLRTFEPAASVLGIGRDLVPSVRAVLAEDHVVLDQHRPVSAGTPGQGLSVAPTWLEMRKGSRPHEELRRRLEEARRAKRPRPRPGERRSGRPAR